MSMWLTFLIGMWLGCWAGASDSARADNCIYALVLSSQFTAGYLLARGLLAAL